VYYSALRITGSPETAQDVCIRAYRLAFANLGSLGYPRVFPTWLDRMSVYISYRSAEERYGGTELNEARAELVAFLRVFHHMSDAEIASLLEANETDIAACDAPSELPQAEDLSMAKETVLAIWHGITGAPLREEPAPEPTNRPVQKSQAADSAARKERSRKRARRNWLRAAAALAVLLVLAAALFAVMRSGKSQRTPEQREVSELASTLSLQLSGHVGEIYQLSDDLYYVSINLGYGGVEGLVVQYELDENQIRLSTPDNVPLTEEQLSKLSEDPSLQVLYDASTGGKGVIKAGATDAAPGQTPAPAKPVPSPAASAHPSPSTGASGSYEIPGEHDYSIMLRINCRNLDLTRPMTLVLDSAISRTIGDAGGLQIMLNDEQHTITLSTAQLNALCSAYGTVTLRFHAEGAREYSIVFYSESGQAITLLQGSMDFTLPADGPMTYVFAVYDSGTESRGGIYDAGLGTVTFPVARSGHYELIGREAEISDIADLDPERAAAAYFLASLQFLRLDEDGCFRPDAPMTRNEVVAVIGRMFLATDPQLTAAYPDVDLSDPAYDYISFATRTSILTGLGDGTFSGEADATREETLTICGRTLLYRLGEEAPEVPEDSGYTDDAEIAEYARSALAALTEYRILSPGGALRPKDTVTRSEAALLLYRMYCRLYGYRAG